MAASSDNQLYIALTPYDPVSELAAIKSFQASLQVWFYINDMARNSDKSHAILFGIAQRVLQQPTVH